MAIHASSSYQPVSARTVYPTAVTLAVRYSGQRNREPAATTTDSQPNEMRTHLIRRLHLRVYGLSGRIAKMKGLPVMARVPQSEWVSGCTVIPTGFKPGVVGPSNIQVLLYIASREQEAGLCFKSQSEIAKDLHVSVSTVKRSISRLVKSGHLVIPVPREAGDYGPNGYAVDFEPEVDQ